MSRRSESCREDVIGRANVEDTPERLAYYEELGRHDAAALWTVANRIEPWEPVSASVEDGVPGEVASRGSPDPLSNPFFEED